MNRKLLVCLSAMCVAASARGQEFVNLNFEAAKIVISATNSSFAMEIATSNALPGWSAFFGTNQAPLVQYNFGPAPGLPVVLFGSNSVVIDGNFSVYLDGGSISQTGLVPSGAKSLLFDSGPPSLLVSLGGQSLAYAAISNALNSSSIIYGADISGFAGQVETLIFSGAGALDDIQFSPEAVPEPSASLIFLGTGVLFYVRRRKRYRFMNGILLAGLATLIMSVSLRG